MALNGTSGSTKHQEAGVELVLRLFPSWFFGGKVLRQSSPTGIIIPIIKQFFRHIRNPYIKS